MVAELIEKAREWHLELNEVGSAARFKGTRVPIDRAMHLFKEGLSAEEINVRFPTLQLSDIYSLIVFYLHNRELVQAYLDAGVAEEKEILSRVDWDAQRAFRDMLLARQAKSA